MIGWQNEDNLADAVNNEVAIFIDTFILVTQH